MKKRKWLGSVLALALTTSLTLVGCGSEPSAQQGGSSGGDSKAEKKDELYIGYVVNFGSHEWYQNIIKGAESTAKEKGYKFEWADANIDLAKQISQAENLLTKGVDVLVLSPVDPKGLSTIMDKAKEKGVPVITESNPIEGAQTTVGIKNLDAGEMIGKWTGEYIKSNFKEKAKVLIVGLPAQQDTRDRVDGFKKGIEASGADYEIVQEVDGSGVKDKALKVSTDAITAHKDINLVYGINDDSALGGQQAYEEAGLDMSKLLTIGFGVEGLAGKDALTSGGPYKAGLAMFPEYVGRTLVEQAEKAVKGEKMEAHTITPMTVMTPENLNEFYTKEGEAWKINFDNVAKLLQK
ncbi:sugar ABC transporter substrate-binding protein [Ammoniphilus resinae]|uniref:ABC-type sugar transport system substrate-binding protein n=1 Tax=Ammoniphilus resinae TaxID=861532 RepID=A0ABS4GW25_9BACL|nr:sugar ABC transporter substrate-binding protein [Ammoniphilus resinae]MBP1934469.1 ABC-type sugar transport system substrate-binding protein [Ammoniphilus resinae]